MKEKSNIELNFDQLYEESKKTVSSYFHNAIGEIDGRFGDGYSKGHPELVGTYLQALVLDFQTATIGKAVLELRDSIDEIRDEIQDVVYKLSDN